MKRRFIRTYGTSGRWCVVDRLRGYRICAFHVRHHGGVHVHHPEAGPVIMRIDIRSAEEAESIMRLYADQHDAFEATRFARGVELWRSASSSA